MIPRGKQRVSLFKEFRIGGDLCTLVPFGKLSRAKPEVALHCVAIKGSCSENTQRARRLSLPKNRKVAFSPLVSLLSRIVPTVFGFEFMRVGRQKRDQWGGKGGRNKEETSGKKGELWLRKTEETKDRGLERRRMDTFWVPFLEFRVQRPGIYLKWVSKELPTNLAKNVLTSKRRPFFPEGSVLSVRREPCRQRSASSFSC